MPGFPTVNFSDSEAGLFTPEEIQRLMQVEFERAVRYEYPIICMLVEVDRLESLHDLYGYESKEEIRNAVIGLMRSMTRVSDFLGCMKDDRLMVMFPHTHRDAASKLADRLLVGARKLRFDSDGRTLRSTLSVGVSYCEPEEKLGYDEFLLAAEEALELAIEAGGDRFVQRGKILRTELKELRDDVDATRIGLQQDRRSSDTSPAPPPFLAMTPRHQVAYDELPEGPLGDKLRRLFEQLGPQSEETAQLQREIIEATLAQFQEARQDVLPASGAPLNDQLEERNRQVDLLERRVRKLANLLDLTESELRRVSGLKEVDPGIASIYRSVQGLSGEERDFELKRQLMSEIFKANVELKEHLGGREA